LPESCEASSAKRSSRSSSTEKRISVARELAGGLARPSSATRSPDRNSIAAVASSKRSARARLVPTPRPEA
jgi:hypothetical protein